MELKQLESYVAVVVYKSFTEAAKQLYISQPTISTHIQALEKELENCSFGSIYHSFGLYFTGIFTGILQTVSGNIFSFNPKR